MHAMSPLPLTHGARLWLARITGHPLSPLPGLPRSQILDLACIALTLSPTAFSSIPALCCPSYAIATYTQLSLSKAILFILLTFILCSTGIADRLAPLCIDQQCLHRGKSDL